MKFRRVPVLVTYWISNWIKLYFRSGARATSWPRQNGCIWY